MNTRIEYHGPLDVFGRCHFSLHWVDSYFPGHPDGEHIVRERGQHFHADPHAYGHLRLGKAQQLLGQKVTVKAGRQVMGGGKNA
jgi:hypothetical protein